MAEGHNEGIQISGGTINAGNLAVGRGATVVAELRERGQEDVARRLEELVRQLEEHRDEVPHLALVRAATESVTEELAKERPDKTRVRDVLAGISESVRSVTGLARGRRRPPRGGPARLLSRERARLLGEMRRWSVMVRAARGWAAAVLLTFLAGCTAAADAPRTSTGTPAARDAPVVETPSPTAVPVPVRAVVVLDPGHNGGNAAAPEEIARPVPAGGFTKPCNTTGTATSDGYAEHAFTFDVAQRTADLLRATGVTVVLTRTDDSGVGPCVNVRAGTANDAAADVAVSIHADGAAPDVRGFHVVSPGLAPDGGNAAILDASAEAASDLLAAFAAATGEPPATYPGALVQPGLTQRNDLAGLNLARVPAVLIECANMRNPLDAAAVTDPGWRQRAAQGIADGVRAYLTSR